LGDEPVLVLAIRELFGGGLALALSAHPLFSNFCARPSGADDGCAISGARPISSSGAAWASCRTRSARVVPLRTLSIISPRTCQTGRIAHTPVWEQTSRLPEWLSQ